MRSGPRPMSMDLIDRFDGEEREKFSIFHDSKGPHPADPFHP